jgi:hypothetical protein
MTGLINPKVRSILGIHEQGELSILSQNKTDIPAQIINENSVQALKAEKLQPEPLEIPATENQPIPSAPLIPEVKETRSAFIEKYEMGSGKNKINVRIFKEPTA